ncbi:hypothetical protein ACFL9T_08660 [Thermodesulfobacteriota bacterium]
MGKIIKLKDKSAIPPENLVIDKPLEFRRADWDNSFFIQMLRSQSAKLEQHRAELARRGHSRIGQLPTHFVLSGSMANTIQALYLHRDNEESMRVVYYLAGLIDCMINQVNPLLRTDLIRGLYKEVTTLKKALNINWHGHIEQVFFPLDQEFYHHVEYQKALSGAKTMRDLYETIRRETDEMFDILAFEYVFYTPGRGA